MRAKNLIINQFAGLGDILFIIPICKHFYDEGYNILFPVNKEFLNLKENFKFINFVDKTSLNIDYSNRNIVETDEYKILPIRFANDLSNGDTTKCMSDKYRYVDLPLDMWYTLSWERNLEKENKLFYDVLKLEDGEKYNFINTSFSMTQNISINVENGLKNVNMLILDEYNILDWYKVIQNASTIHTVGTSLLFVLEVIDLKVDEINLYKKPINDSFNYVHLLRKKYKLC